MLNDALNVKRKVLLGKYWIPQSITQENILKNNCLYYIVVLFIYSTILIVGYEKRYPQNQFQLLEWLREAEEQLAREQAEQGKDAAEKMR